MRRLGLPRFETCVVEGEHVVASHGDGVSIVCLKTGAVLSAGAAGAQSRVNCLAATKRGVVSAAADGAVQEWSSPGGEPLGDRVDAARRVLGIATDVSAATLRQHSAGLLYVASQKAESEARQDSKDKADSKDKDKAPPLFELVVWSLATQQKVNVLDGKLPRGSERACHDCVATYDGGNFNVVAFAARYHLQLYLVDANAPVKRARATCMDDPFTSLAMTSLSSVVGEDVVVSGHRSGHVRIWRSALDPLSDVWAAEAKKGKAAFGALSVATALHWHAHPVAAVAVSACGANVLSGGEEAVLVVWPLRRDSASATSLKDFLPRLGAPIKCIRGCEAPEGTPRCAARASLAVVATADSAVHVIVVQGLKRLWSFYGLSTFKRLSATLLAPDWKRGKLALNSTPGALQLWDASEDRVTEVLRVVQHNHVPAALGDASTPRAPVVLRAAFSHDGTKLATVDTWQSADEGHRDEHLKFWTRDGGDGKFQGGWRLHSMISNPHGAKGCSVAGLAFHPKLHVVASVALDGALKLWACLDNAAPRGDVSKPAGKKRKAENAQDKAPQQWRCTLSVAGDDDAAGDLAFSADGSLLAVAHLRGPRVALWDVSTGLKVATLHRAHASAEAKQAFVSVGVFDSGPADALPRIALADGRGVDVFDLRTGAVAWSYAADVCCCAVATKAHLADDAAVSIALAVRRRTAAGTAAAVLLFSHLSPEPLKCVSLQEAPRGLVFLPRRGGGVAAELRDRSFLEIDAPSGTSTALAASHRHRRAAVATGVTVYSAGEDSTAAAGSFDFAGLLNLTPAWDGDLAMFSDVGQIFDCYLAKHLKQPPVAGLRFDQLRATA
ncbi:WD40-repeat-containing domain protein [Pelagophyceae sp. CCMP2097]|nr:WD40-repeat-containing domain protein [Pelagophyceae sp. CCMP2097]|mmetsp:Transcript_29714/g.100064  ORF Transcript_29714/g.100064 Transcript_29714/m.100064 type:complete len:840 (-) Transcript_29714:56-2575(-)